MGIAIYHENTYHYNLLVCISQAAWFTPGDGLLTFLLLLQIMYQPKPLISYLSTKTIDGGRFAFVYFYFTFYG